jgi:hypothetical protein
MSLPGPSPVEAALPDAQSARAARQRRWGWVGLCLVVGCVALLRARLLEVPLERDEGEFAYAGQLLLEGIPPYQLASNMKLPGAYAAYAVIMAVCGQTVSGIRLGLLAVNLVTIALVFVLGKRLFGPAAGLLAAACYGVLSVSPAMLGFAGHATHFVALFAVAATVLMWRGIESGRRSLMVASGALFGLGFIMKQPGAAFVLFGLAWVAGRHLRHRPARWAAAGRDAAWFAAGAVAPFLLTCLWLAMAGVFGNFWFWTFQYAREYASLIPLRDAPRQLRNAASDVIMPHLALWLLAGLGAAALFADRPRRSQAALAAAWLAFSFLAVCPGFYFRSHYFIVMLPAIALAVGGAAALAQEWLRAKGLPAIVRAWPVIIVSATLFHGVWRYREIFFVFKPDRVSREVYGGNPFPESVQVAGYIHAHSAPDDRILVLGSEPQIYFYSGRKSATTHIYMYGLMEPQPFASRMQQQLIAEAEAARPAFIVVVNTPASWLARPESNLHIVHWAERYLAEHYTLAGAVEILSVERTQYYWDRQVRHVIPGQPADLMIFRRNSAGSAPR